MKYILLRKWLDRFKKKRHNKRVGLSVKVHLTDVICLRKQFMRRFNCKYFYSCVTTWRYLLCRKREGIIYIKADHTHRDLRWRSRGCRPGAVLWRPLLRAPSWTVTDVPSWREQPPSDRPRPRSVLPTRGIPLEALQQKKNVVKKIN